MVNNYELRSIMWSVRHMTHVLSKAARCPAAVIILLHADGIFAINAKLVAATCRLARKPTRYSYSHVVWIVVLCFRFLCSRKG